MSKEASRIKKHVRLQATQERVWQAITDSRQFGHWFGIEFDGPFEAGKAVHGRIVPTQVDEAVAKMQAPYSGMSVVFLVQSIEPMTYFSFRWHPNAVDPGQDYSKEPTTLVEFRLSPEGAGTELVIEESGFESIPVDRRAQAFSSNEEGWTAQVRLIEAYLSPNERQL